MTHKYRGYYVHCHNDRIEVRSELGDLVSVRDEFRAVPEAHAFIDCLADANEKSINMVNKALFETVYGKNVIPFRRPA